MVEGRQGLLGLCGDLLRVPYTCIGVLENQRPQERHATIDAGYFMWYRFEMAAGELVAEDKRDAEEEEEEERRQGAG